MQHHMTHIWYNYNCITAQQRIVNQHSISQNIKHLHLYQFHSTSIIMSYNRPIAAISSDRGSSANAQLYSSGSSLASTPIPALAIAAHGLLLTGLAGYVSYVRTNTKTLDGHKGEKTTLGKAVRAHGNAAEYCQYLSTTYLFYALQPHKRTTITDALIITSTVGRVLNAVGLLTAGPGAGDLSPARSIGAISTYLSTAGLAVSIAYDVLNKKM